MKLLAAVLLLLRLGGEILVAHAFRLGCLPIEL